jgi:hypothetical protein
MVHRLTKSFFLLQLKLLYKNRLSLPSARSCVNYFLIKKKQVAIILFSNALIRRNVGDFVLTNRHCHHQIKKFIFLGFSIAACLKRASIFRTLALSFSIIHPQNITQNFI